MYTVLNIPDAHRLLDAICTEAMKTTFDNNTFLNDTAAYSTADFIPKTRGLQGGLTAAFRIGHEPRFPEYLEGLQPTE